MNPFTLSSILTVITTLPLGFFVYWQNRKQSTNRIWLLYTLALVVWGVFGALISLTESRELALIYWRLAIGFGIIWMPVLFYHFAYLYAPWKEKKLLVGAYIITAIFALLSATSWYIPRVEYLFSSFYWSRPGIAFYFLTAWWFILTGYSHTKLYKDSKTMPRERQNQIKYFIFASSVGYLGGLLDFSITYGSPVYPWGNFLIVVYPFIMTYAIIKHGLFDIFIVIKRVFYSAILVGVIAVSISGISVFNVFLQEQFGLQTWVGLIIAGILTVYIIYLFLYNSRHADKIKKEFITVAAHKLRTPLTHIRYIAEELKHVKTPEETAVLVSQLTESNDIMISLVNKLLDVINLETQTEKYEFTSLSLVALTTSVIQAMRGVSQLKKITIDVQAEDNVPNAEGNEKSVTFTIQSLIENALMYTPAGGKISISISRNKDKLMWSVTDTGIGIAQDDSNKIFEKFFRGDNALKTDTEGTGLALFMARSLIKRQGGSMGMESPGVGLGSRFWFTLPVSEK